MAYIYAGHYAQAMQNQHGNALPSISVKVYTDSGLTTLATLYTDRTKGTTTPNPTAADVAGNLNVYTDPGVVYLVPVHLEVDQDDIKVTVPIDPADAIAQPFAAAGSVVVQDGGVEVSPTAAILNFEGADVTLDSPGLVTIAGLQGETGPAGATGGIGPAGATGATGSAGATGEGVPVGGTAGQVLAKASGTDYDTGWVEQTGGGGTDDQTAAEVPFTPAGNIAATNVQTAIEELEVDALDAAAGASAIATETANNLAENYETAAVGQARDSAHIASLAPHDAAGYVRAVVYDATDPNGRLVSGYTIHVKLTGGNDPGVGSNYPPAEPDLRIS